MTQLNRTEEQLTTADFAGTARPVGRPDVQDAMARGEFDTAEIERPGLVRNENEANGTRWTSNVTPPISDKRDASVTSVRVGGAGVQEAGAVTPLLSDTELSELRSRWNNIQAEFVDEPRRSVEQADQLVAAAMQRLAEGFANERASLEKQWDSGDSVSTEDLRIALQRYRAFFGRLLNAA